MQVGHYSWQDSNIIAMNGLKEGRSVMCDVTTYISVMQRPCLLKDQIFNIIQHFCNIWATVTMHLAKKSTMSCIFHMTSALQINLMCYLKQHLHTQDTHVCIID